MRKKGNKANSFTIDHIVPKSLGGTNCISNLAGLCRYCNNAKSDNKIVLIDAYYKYLDDVYKLEAIEYTLSESRLNLSKGDMRLLIKQSILILSRRLGKLKHEEEEGKQNT